MASNRHQHFHVGDTYSLFIAESLLHVDDAVLGQDLHLRWKER